MMILAMNDRLNRNPAATLITKFLAGLTIMLFFMLKHHLRNLDLVWSYGSRRSCFFMASYVAIAYWFIYIIGDLFGARDAVELLHSDSSFLTVELW